LHKGTFVAGGKRGEGDGTVYFLKFLFVDGEGKFTVLEKKEIRGRLSSSEKKEGTERIARLRGKGKKKAPSPFSLICEGKGGENTISFKEFRERRKRTPSYP